MSGPIRAARGRGALVAACCRWLQRNADRRADPAAARLRRRRRGRAPGHGQRRSGSPTRCCSPRRSAILAAGPDAGDADRRHRSLGRQRRDRLGLSDGDQCAALGDGSPRCASASASALVVGVDQRRRRRACCGVQPLVMTLGTGLMTQGVHHRLQPADPGQRAARARLHPGARRRQAARDSFPIDLFAVGADRALADLRRSRRTGFGRLLYAVGDNREACHLAGVRVWRVLLVDY